MIIRYILEMRAVRTAGIVILVRWSDISGSRREAAMRFVLDPNSVTVPANIEEKLNASRSGPDRILHCDVYV